MRFEQLIEQYHNEIFAYLWRLLGKASSRDGAADVEDLTQDVFLRAYQNFERLRAGSNHRAWLYKIATNCAYSSFRGTRNGRGRLLRLKDTAIDEALERSPSSAEAVAKSRLAQRVRNLTNSLPTKQKAALVLRYLQELDYAEIAAIMNCSEPSARANVYQALRCLRAALSEER